MIHSKKYDAIIVGHGLSGTLLAYFLRRQNILVIDEQLPTTASKIAAGMYTTISGKRMTKEKDSDEKLRVALNTYRSIEHWLNAEILHPQNSYTIFGSVKEHNDLSTRMDDAFFAKEIKLNPSPPSHTKAPFGAFEVKNTGWVNLPKLLDIHSQYLSANNALRMELFDYNALIVSEKKCIYKDVSADKIFFCEGVKAIDNPYFKSIPFQLCKGDVIEIATSELDINRIIKKGIYIVPLGKDKFKVGATYHWNYTNALPEVKDREFLEVKLSEMLSCSWNTLSHQAALRPTTVTRETYLRVHDKYNWMYMINGMGTKGVLNAPFAIATFLKRLGLLNAEDDRNLIGVNGI